MVSVQTQRLRDAILILSTLIPGIAAQLFTISCAPLAIYRGDPLVFDGQISSHVHAIVGSTAFDLHLPNEKARGGKATTCDKVLDRSSYWQPQLYHERKDGKFEIVELQGMAGYYMNRACDYAPGRMNCTGQPIAKAPPKGLRMVVGNPFLRTFNKTNPEQRAISHICLGENAGDTPHLPVKQCDRMRAETFFPSCWDGKNLDSPTHKHHMAFPAIGDYNTGVCPESHPIAIYSIFLEFFYNTGNIENYNRLVWAMGDASGYGLHGDFINGWTDQTALERALETCAGDGGVTNANCSLNVGPDGPGAASRQPPEVRPPPEDVGINGTILNKLPGDNPVTGNPEE
ncbi:hypothetical protein E4U09_005055 [Claviceps aff. purpurea]|uniref:DUF1996 domain-containing protein n=1 Tax=Claviceps aff. purpurea TaxID=1967640 RepID=A0A9P7U057_9HYPO|nr:hypothetical protein E4U09_005055 [Claviceps aff. purpurea]